MPSESNSAATSNLSPTPQAIKGALDAVSIATWGMDSVDDLRAVLEAIYKLAQHDEVIRDLSRVGVAIAESRHNQLDCERENQQQKIAVLRGTGNA